MFKENVGYKQLDAFAVRNTLNKQQQKLWNRSKEHRFFHEIFAKIDESHFEVLFSAKYSRPNVPVNQMVSALILKHLNNWTYEALFNNLNFNLLTRHALGIQSIDEHVFSPASIFNFQNRLIVHLKKTGSDLIEKIFSQLTLDQIKEFGLDTSVQRGDSFLIGSNIVDYSRLHLLVEVIDRLYRVLSDEDQELVAELVEPYRKTNASNYVFHVSKEALPDELSQISHAYAKMRVALSNRYENEETYKIFYRVFNDHFKLGEENNVSVLPTTAMHSGILLSPDDTEATFRGKRSQTSKGYVAHLSETVNPNNEFELITDVTVEQNNVGDAEILEQRLLRMKEQTPELKEYFVDGQYGSPGVDVIADKEDIKIYQKAVRGRKSKAGIRIQETEDGNFTVGCKGGQSVDAHKSKKEIRWKAEFDMQTCLQCALYEQCSLKESGGKTKAKRKVYYFTKEQVLSHKRIQNMNALDSQKKKSRANVEATVKEAKRGMNNGKVRVRGRTSVTMYMLFTAMAINFTRLWSNFDRQRILALYEAL